MTNIYKTGLPRENLSLVIGSRSQTKLKDVITCIKEIRWETKRIGAPAKLQFSLMVAKDMGFWEGDRVTFSAKGEVIFTGYVFEKEKTHKGEITVTCFDQLRYLKARQSYNFTGQSADGIIRKIAGDFGLTCGALTATGYAIPSLVMDNQTCLDTIFTALEMTADATGRSYCFFEEKGALCLKASTAMVSPYILGDESFTEGFSYLTSINNGVHNYIKLVRPNENTGAGDAYVVKAPDSINRWGMLQYYERVNKDYTAGEIQEMAKMILLKDNRLQRNLTLRCIGLSDIRSGHVVKVELANMGEMAANQYLTVDGATHIWNENGYTMDLAFSIFREGDLDYAIAMTEFSEYLDVALKESSSDRSSKSSKTAKASKKKSSSSGKSTADDSSVGSGKYRLPYHGSYRMSTPFGKAGRTWSCGWHTGVDYVGISDKNIYAICGGTVISVAKKASYGNCVQIRHTDGYTSVYAHLSAIYVKNGQKVTTNTKVGREGATGKAYGSHLHLELHKGAFRYPPNPKVNPHTYILGH